MGDWEVMMIKGGGHFVKCFSSGSGPFRGCIYYDRGYVNEEYVVPVQILTTDPLYRTSKEAVAAMELLVKTIREIPDAVPDSTERSNE